MRLFLCPSAVNETASGFRWVLFPAFGQHKEVMLLKHKCPSPRIGKKPRGNTVDEIQDILGISRPTAYNLVKQGVFHSVRVGGHIRISKKSFDDWLDHADE